MRAVLASLCRIGCADDISEQIDVINELMLLTAKPVTYLVNLSERDYIRKKNKWLPKIKAWIDEHAPGDILLPFSVALEERLFMEYAGNPEGMKEELEKIGTATQIPKIMKTGYQMLSVRILPRLHSLSGGSLTFSFAGVGFARTAHSLLHLWSGRGPCLDDP